MEEQKRTSNIFCSSIFCPVVWRSMRFVLSVFAKFSPALIGDGQPLCAPIRRVGKRLPLVKPNDAPAIVSLRELC
jgi:hypothetical protein